MHQIKCPYCGVRDEAEFRYRGDATRQRPSGDTQTQDALFEFVYLRDNPAGWHMEWWQHVHGCRQVVRVSRNTLTHEIAGVWRADDTSFDEGAR